MSIQTRSKIITMNGNGDGIEEIPVKVSKIPARKVSKLNNDTNDVTDVNDAKPLNDNDGEGKRRRKKSVTRDSQGKSPSRRRSVSKKARKPKPSLYISTELNQESSPASPVDEIPYQTVEVKQPVTQEIQIINDNQETQPIQTESPIPSPFFSENVEKIKSEIQKLFVEEIHNEANIKCPIIDETPSEVNTNKLDEDKPNVKCAWFQNGYLKIDHKIISQIVIISILMLTCLWLINYFSVVPKFELQSITESINDVFVDCIDGFKNYFESISYF